MKILLGVPSLGYKQKNAIYAALCEQIFNDEHRLLPPYDPNTLAESTGNHSALDVGDWRSLAEREIQAANACDAAIFDVTNKATFGVGYLAAMVFGRNKPTHFLSEVGSLEGSIITGLVHKKLMRKIYDTENVAVLVRSFLNEVTA